MIPLRPEEWQRVRRVFDGAVVLDADERAGFVTAACRGDEDVRLRVSAMLDAHDHAQGFLETACVATVVAWREKDLTGAQFGPYQLESRIGGGGMGEVYRARDTRLGRTVAIKVLLSHIAAGGPARERFEREARVVAGLSHPHICTLHDVGTHPGPTGQTPVQYLVMEFLDGETLADRLAKGPLPIEDALDYAIQIASALDAAHRVGVIHRDLKPRNIMVTSAGAKLLDFGVAKAAEPGALAPDDDLTTPGTIIGTLHYMAPEQLESLPTDARTDLFAFGCVVYEMLSGRKAFEARSSAGLLTAIMAQVPTPLGDLAGALPAGFEELVDRCLAKRPEDRWQSSADLLLDLRRIAGQVRAGAGSGRFRRLLARPRLAAAGGLVALALSGGAAVYLNSRTPASPPAASPPSAPLQLAVLPLQMVGDSGGSDDYLRVGIADSIISRLAAVRQIGLRPTAAVLAYANKPADPATVARELSVGHLLFGTIQRNGETYRITLQLVQSSDGALTWARSYDVFQSGLTNLQDTIAEEVVAALRVELSDPERARVQRRYTDNAQAYALYLRGRASMVTYTEKGMQAAIGDLERAIVLDPDYALARAGLAVAAAWYSVRYAYDSQSLEWGARAEREAKTALAADPSLAEATLAMASAAGTLHGSFNWSAVIADTTRALAIDPTLELAHVERMRAFFHLGLFDRMADEAQAAGRLNPLGNVVIARLEVARNLFSGSFERAREQATALLARSDVPVIRNYLGLAQFYTGDVAAARATLAGVQRAGRPDVRSQAALAGVEAAAGDRGAARARVAAIQEGPDIDHHVAYSLAAAWAQLGDAAASAKWLRQAAATGFTCYPWLMRDRLFDPIRRDPRFIDVLGELRSRYEQDEARYRTSPR